MFNLKRSRFLAGCTALVFVTNALSAEEFAATPEPVGSKAQSVLTKAAAEGKFTFIVFYRDGSPVTRNVVETAKQSVAKRQERAALTYVQIADPAERDLVAKYNVGRAPMPMTLAIAPNGAVTGFFAQQLADSNFDDAIVTPTMTKCMKALQEGKLVFVCVQATKEQVVPNAVKSFQADPMFANRVELVSLQLRDPAETRFLNQMQIDAQQTLTSMAVLLAPPGAMVGKYGPTATKEEIAYALHQSGKCCEDPNCKHNQAPSNARPASRSSANGRN